MPIFSTTAKFVVDTITDMIADSTIGPDQTLAVIYRTNAQSRYLEEACVHNNLPYVIRGGAGGFYKRAEVKQKLAEFLTPEQMTQLQELREKKAKRYGRNQQDDA